MKLRKLVICIFLYLYVPVLVDKMKVVGIVFACVFSLFRIQFYHSNKLLNFIETYIFIMVSFGKDRVS